MWRLVAAAIVFNTGKVPARWDNNAHKRLSEEASGAAVFHTALNGAAAACVFYIKASDTAGVGVGGKIPLS